MDAQHCTWPAAKVASLDQLGRLTLGSLLFDFKRNVPQFIAIPMTYLNEAAGWGAEFSIFGDPVPGRGVSHLLIIFPQKSFMPNFIEPST